MSGTLIGTAGSYQSKGNTIANAMDGSAATFFDAPAGVQGWVGLSFPAPETITQIQFVPRSGFTSRMIGGTFQGSNTPDFSAGVTNLYTVTNSPAGGVYTVVSVSNSASFDYVRYLSPVSGSGNIAEVEFDGAIAGPPLPPAPPPAPVIVPPPPAAPLAPSNLMATGVSASDVHLSWLEDPRAR